MNPSANRPEDRSQETGDRSQGPIRRHRWTGGLLLLATVAAAVALAPRCNKTRTTSTGDDKGDGQKTDPWDGAVKRLRKESDLSASRAAITQLKNDLANRTDVPGPPPLAKDAEAALAALVPLAPTDLNEVRPPAFSNLDAVYLADCLYLRDAARSLEPSGTPPAKLAEQAFAWVCRQVYRQPWVIEGQGVVPAVPPTYVLRRGSGAALERAYVFLALLQQLGLDGCLVGPPDAADKPASYSPPGPDGRPLPAGPRGPFWAVGVRVGADVLLFDPWRGQPFPGPDGKGVGTLAQLKANPDPLKSWFEAKDPAWGVGPDDVKKAAVFLAVPVSALSPRMAVLEEKLKADVGVRLAVKPAELRERFTAAAPAGPGLPAAEVKFWNPVQDRFAYGRVLATFLPIAEGGLDPTPDGPNQLFAVYGIARLPRGLFNLPPELTEQSARERLANVLAGLYAAAFVTPPAPREQIQRGQFQDAARGLSDKQDAFQRGRERLLVTRDAEQVRQWCAEVDRLYADLGNARLDKNPAAEAAALARIEQFWKERGQTAQVVVDRALASAGLAEASYLLALCKHEQAERHQARAERATGPADKARAVDAWREAHNAWLAYAQHAPAHAGFPGRAEHARGLTDRARALAGEK
jgi:hypothetical protein